MKSWEDVLVSIAYSVLNCLKGSGHWRMHRERFVSAEDPLRGLSVCDTVYIYDDEEGKIVCRRVCYVKDDVGYYAQWDSVSGPYLVGIEASIYGKTREEAIEIWKDEIRTDAEYHEVRAKGLAELRASNGTKS